MNTQLGTSDGFLFQLPPLELMIIWFDQFMGGTVLPEIFSISVIIIYVWFWGFWKLSSK